MMDTKLIQDKDLEWSPVVANNAMNRKRIAFGVNSYENELKFNPLTFLTNRTNQKSIDWMDLCCGEGNALIQSARHLKNHKHFSKFHFEGIDLVDFFSPFEPNNILQLKQMNLLKWKPKKEYDLITIIHGLHYIGDKIKLIIKAASVLKKDGLFIGHLDLNNILLNQEQDSNLILDFFKSNDVNYNKRTKIIKIKGKRIINQVFKYNGADDQAGPNFTGQPVVNSYYS